MKWLQKRPKLIQLGVILALALLIILPIVDYYNHRLQENLNDQIGTVTNEIDNLQNTKILTLQKDVDRYQSALHGDLLDAMHESNYYGSSSLFNAQELVQYCRNVQKDYGYLEQAQVNLNDANDKLQTKLQKLITIQMNQGTLKLNSDNRWFALTVSLGIMVLCFFLTLFSLNVMLTHEQADARATFYKVFRWSFWTLIIAFFSFLIYLGYPVLQVLASQHLPAADPHS